MDSHLFVALEDVMDKWIDQHCMDDEWPNEYIYEYQGRDMARAAALVFDASVKAQRFAKENNG